MDPISHHLISKILSIWVSASNYFDNKGFFYFNEGVNYGKFKIDRIGKGLVYCEDEIVPVTWSKLSGVHLKEIYDKVKNKKMYFYRESPNGGFIRVRLKYK